MSNLLEELTKSAEALLVAGDLDGAERAIDAVLQKLSRFQTKEDSDTYGYDDLEEAADDDDDEDEDDDQDEVEKAAKQSSDTDLLDVPPTTKQSPMTKVDARGRRNFEDWVSQEMASKGVTEEVARQRIIKKFGSAVLRTGVFAKNDQSTIDRFQKRADEIMLQEGVDRVTALRKARLEAPNLFAALQAL